MFVDCRNNCSDHACENQCLIQLGECVSDCPCGQNCPNGCSDCDHPLCNSCQNLETDFEFQVTLLAVTILLLDVQQCKVHALQEFDQCAMDCLNSWQCIDACYKTGLLENFSKCDCFGEIPNLDNDKDGHLTLLADEEHYYEPTNIAYVTNVNGGFQEKFEIVY